jgi:hypothetical protein
MSKATSEDLTEAALAAVTGGDFAAAARAFAAVAATARADPKPHEQLAQCLMALERDEEAVAAAREAAALAPQARGGKAATAGAAILGGCADVVRRPARPSQRLPDAARRAPPAPLPPLPDTSGQRPG